MAKRYKGLNPKQFEALSSIAFGGDGRGFHTDTLKSLEKRGLIEGYDSPFYGRGNSPIDRIPVIVRKYFMPISEHMEFCQWCADNCEDEDCE